MKRFFLIILLIVYFTGFTDAAVNPSHCKGKIIVGSLRSHNIKNCPKHFVVSFIVDMNQIRNDDQDLVVLERIHGIFKKNIFMVKYLFTQKLAEELDLEANHEK